MSYQSKYDKTRIDRITLVSGKNITDAILEIEAPRIPGFMAIQSQKVENAVEYIALSDVSSFTIRNTELAKTPSSYYFSPELKVKLER